MFKLPNRLPTRYAGIHELADYTEAQCYLNQQVSAQEIVRYLAQVDDIDFTEGCDDVEDQIRDRMDDVVAELDRRQGACVGGYPFAWKDDRNGEVLRLNADAARDPQFLVYIYLLLSTRLDMNKNRTHAKLDGTRVLEVLSKYVLKAFLGSKSRVMVFGTAAKGGFRERVAALCVALGEGGGLREREGEVVQAQDDGLDVVGWIPFADGEAGKLIVFGQCKTGTDWQDQTSDLQPLDFAKKWLADTFPVEPMRAHFIAESINRQDWRRSTISGGLLFDRCRLVEYGAHLPQSVLADLAAWIDGAQQSIADSMKAA